jgi:hypothetical protein
VVLDVDRVPEALGALVGLPARDDGLEVRECPFPDRELVCATLVEAYELART